LCSESIIIGKHKDVQFILGLDGDVIEKLLPGSIELGRILEVGDVLVVGTACEEEE
jgi:hypothetical protein